MLTQDWHPPQHISFASSHKGRRPLERVHLQDSREQILWPDHCLKGSPGAALAAGLKVDKAELVIRKGFRVGLDSYSAFAEADGTPTGLAGFLRERGLTRALIVGLATDFCAGFTAIDAAQAGFDTMLIEDASRGIDIDGSMARMRTAMLNAGVAIGRVAEIITG